MEAVVDTDKASGLVGCLLGWPQGGAICTVLKHKCYKNSSRLR